MNKRIIQALAVFVVLAIAIVLVWNYVNYLDYLSEIVHETDRWAVIEDLNGHHVAVEPSSDNVWDQLVRLYQNGTSMWIGGIVKEYGGKRGLRCKPETVIVAEVTAEGLQATIEYITENVDYWLGLGLAYVDAKVTEIHE